MSQQIAVIANLSPVEIFGADNIDPIIGKIEQEVRSFHFDISTPGGRKAIAALAHKIARSKTALDAMGKGLTDTARETIEAINTERRAIRERLDALKEEIRRPLTEWEDKEKDRIQNHKRGLEALSAMIVFAGQPSSKEVFDRIRELKSFHAARIWEEFETPAKTAFENTEQKLIEMREDFARREAEQAELERLRKEKEERETRERDELIARKAAEQAKLEAEQKAKADADKAEAKVKAEREELERKVQAERDESERQRREDKEKIEAAEQAKKEAEDRAKQDAEDAALKERQHIEAEKIAADKAAAAREANKQHHAKINNEALTAFTKAGLSEDHAKLAVEAIAKRQITHVTIGY